MFELIGILVVAWVGFIVVRNLLRGFSTVRSQEIGEMALHCATRDLEVPEAYYRHECRQHMEAIKQGALLLRGSKGGHFKKVRWPRLLALVVYDKYHRDCHKFEDGDPWIIAHFIELGLTSEDVDAELDRDPKEVSYTLAGKL